MTALLQTALMDLDQEFTSTRRMLERLPDDRLDFTPHPKSWPLGKLATHLLEPPLWAKVTCETTELSFDAPMPAMVMNHMVHHRAQLSMYLRLLDVPMPGMYGPSADEK